MRLEATRSDQARDELLEKEKRFVNRALLSALGMKAIVRIAEDQLETSLEAAHKALALYESLGLKPGIALAEENLASIYRALGDHRRAFQFAQASLHHAPMDSYLTLAEGGPKDDGLLEAWELMQLDLKANLAVLSACETARGRIGAGEGVIGLSWAMFIAGVPSTVVSQWKVESASTRDLMVNFHRSLLSSTTSKATKADALRQAALKLMRNPETSHPFYWAGFVLVGDGG